MKKVSWVLGAMVLVFFLSAQAHEHKAPHKGTLVALEDEVINLELVIDSATGKVSGYVLDAHAENAVRVKQASIEIVVLKADKSADFSFTLKQQANELSGEKEGDSSEFAGVCEKLKGLKTFDAKVVAATVRGKEYKDVVFNFPKGNE